MFNCTHDFGGRASGGVSVLIWNDIPHRKINIATNIQAVAIKAALHKAVNIGSIYIPPSNDIDKNKLKNLIDQLARPFILLGDFNCHNTVWGCKDTNQKGKMLEKVLFTIPSARAGYDTRSIFKRSLTGLNSEFSFS